MDRPKPEIHLFCCLQCNTLLVAALGMCLQCTSEAFVVHCLWFIIYRIAKPQASIGASVGGKLDVSLWKCKSNTACSVIQHVSRFNHLLSCYDHHRVRDQLGCNGSNSGRPDKRDLQQQVSLSCLNVGCATIVVIQGGKVWRLERQQV